ncbi:M20 family metallopeptidase [Facklamia miroungae]|uniref:Dipeptidase, putative n=1 Tax=Facklamia miroungae TaxID=120956 RepID=A0A1G7R011_9LACT|nr:M20 family metallopeptidase [Facklamia miroungae]NKZ29128.1 Sapep family Mn(2+)-dependent dipeptidase [Facklamia miroungae]SDG04093.1 dipeptidase, putative [Facklamia miroungae]
MDYQLTKDHQKPAIETLKQWISIPSVLDENDSKTPFGQPIQEMLELALATCRDMGMETYIDPEGYYGYAEMGQGEELFGVLCHLDVVPALNPTEWTTPPFEMDIRDGALFGRGTQDDKGPSIAALYALKALLDQGHQLNKRVRFIFGTDEENLWRGLNRYNEKEEQVSMGIVPDSAFPLTYAEKGLLQLHITGPGSDAFEMNNKGALNVVPDKAVYKGDKTEELSNILNELAYKYEVNEETLTVLGKSVHSKDSLKGDNALAHLLEAMSELYDHPILNFVKDNFAKDVNGQSIFGQVEDEASGSLTCNIANLEVDANHSKLGIDMRIPVTADKDQLVETLTKAAKEYQLEYEEFDYLASLYVPVDSELVTTLLKVYRDLTGDMTEPISSGGATFARTMKNCVAFGALQEGVADTMHQVDERMPLDNFYQTMEIYAHALKALVIKA